MTTALYMQPGHSPEAGYETIIVNNNPETVSTDFDIADKLYFEPLTPEDVESIVNIGESRRSSCAVRRTDSHQADRKPDEDGRSDSWYKAQRMSMRRRTESCLMKFWSSAGFPVPQAERYYTAEEAKAVANRLGYPVLVRPSYVLGGQGMQIAISDSGN